MSIILRPYQQRLIDKIRHEIAEGYTGIMAVASTGAGKTICFSYIAENAAAIGSTTFIFVHRKELIRQTSKSLTANGIAHGVIAAGYPPTNHQIQVVSIQSFIGRMHKYKQPDIVVFDEAHHCMAKNYLKVIRWAQQADTIILGVTATPCRADQQSFRYATDPDTKELYEVFQVMVECDDIGTLINDGWLVRPSVYAPEIKGITDTPGRLVDGEFILKELAELRDKPQITGDAIEHYKKYCPSRPPTIVFCVSVAHAQHCAMEFTQAGIPSESIDGSMDDDQRAAIIGRVESGRTVCLMSCDLVSEGFDLPAMSCAIMLRDIGPKSLSLFMQQVGRILRPSPGKTEAILLDHVENWIRHGFVEEKRDWFETFNGTKKRAPKSKGATLSRCPKCFSVFPPVPKCPACGHDLRPPAGEGGGREIETADGELVKLNTAEILNLRSAAPITGRRKTLIQKLERA